MNDPESKKSSSRQTQIRSPENATESSGLAEEDYVDMIFLTKGTDDDLPLNYDEC